MDSQLVLMRHAKSDWHSGVEDDFSRPLNRRGNRDAQKMGGWLNASNYLPDRILSSTANRTRETVDRMSEGADCDLASRTVWVPELYLGSVQDLLTAFSHSGGPGRTMLLAHNPGMEELLDWLAPEIIRGAPGNEKTFPTAAVYVLELEGAAGGIKRGSARLIAHQRPKALGE